MNGFIEVHDPQFDRIVVVNPDCIAEYADHYILVDRAHSIETKETREEIAALIAAEYTTVTCNCDVPKHATADPKEIGVDVERVQLEKLLIEWSVFKQYISTVLEFNGRGIDWSQGRWNEIDSRFMDLRAALGAKEQKWVTTK